MRTLEDKVSIITGAASGIGKAITLAFLEEGALVYAVDLEPTALEALELSLDEETRKRFIPYVLDVTDFEGMKQLFLTLKKDQGRIDALVNNAGVVINRALGMISHAELVKLFSINAVAVIEWIQMASRFMSRQKQGSIVNIASVTAVLGSPGQVAYSASKGAVISATRSAAKELAPQGVRVNAVAPGIVQTERFQELYKESEDKINTRIAKIGLGRLGKPEDVANACVFLSSDKASYISGQILGVDGCAAI